SGVQLGCGFVSAPDPFLASVRKSPYFFVLPGGRITFEASRSRPPELRAHGMHHSGLMREVESAVDHPDDRGPPTSRQRATQNATTDIDQRTTDRGNKCMSSIGG